MGVGLVYVMVDKRPCGRSDVRPVGRAGDVTCDRTCYRADTRANGVMGRRANGRNDTWTDMWAGNCTVKLADGRTGGLPDTQAGRNDRHAIVRRPIARGAGWVDECVGGLLRVVGNAQRAVFVSFILHLSCPCSSFITHHFLALLLKHTRYLVYSVG